MKSAKEKNKTWFYIFPATPTNRYDRVWDAIFIWNYVLAEKFPHNPYCREIVEIFPRALADSAEKQLVITLLKRRQEQFNHYGFFVENYNAEIVGSKLSITVMATALG